MESAMVDSMAGLLGCPLECSLAEMKVDSTADKKDLRLAVQMV